MDTVTRDATTRAVPRYVFEHSAWDAVLVLLAAAHGALLLTVPGVLVIAVGLWWNSNTISHYFIHNPFFRSRILNQIFEAYLSVLLGFPHALWRTRHLAHHAETARRIEWSAVLIAQTVLVLAMWVLLGTLNSMFFLTVYLCRRGRWDSDCARCKATMNTHMEPPVATGPCTTCTAIFVRLRMQMTCWLNLMVAGLRLW